MSDNNPAVMPDDGDDEMTYEPLSCVTVTRDEPAHLRSEVARLRLLSERIAQDETTALVLVNDLRRRVAELEGENAALLDGRGQLQAALAAAARANAELRAGIANIEAHGGGTADSSFARARIREALGDGEVQNGRD